MSPSNNSTPRAAGGAAATAVPIAPEAPQATPDVYAATLASAQASGLASNAFGVRDSRGIVPMSLPPEGEWDSLQTLISVAQEHASLAGYAVVEGPREEMRKEKGPQ